MSDRSSIEWTDATWNPFRARDGLGRHFCLRISDGCDHCYASTINARFAGTDSVYARYRDASTETLADAREHVQAGRLYLDQGALQIPLRWRRPRRIFVGSMTDLFGEWVPDSWLDQVWMIMAACPQHTFQVLTKRPGRMQDYLSDPIHIQAAALDLLKGAGRSVSLIWRWPLPNVWLGTTIEEDRFAWRAQVLAETPAAVRFVSAEPLLSGLPSLKLAVPCDVCHTMTGRPTGRVYGYDASGGLQVAVCPRCDGLGHRRRIDWLIAGGESAGPPARRLVVRCPDARHPWGTGVPRVSDPCAGQGWMPSIGGAAYVRDLRDRCQAAGVAFFLKQWGGPQPHSGGRLLDGREWNQFPQSRALVPA